MIQSPTQKEVISRGNKKINKAYANISIPEMPDLSVAGYRS
jgi:hypothetical protein